MTRRWQLHRPCPSCAAPLAPGQLRKLPHTGALRWYQFTPAPKTACPHCGQVLLASAANSRWLWVVFLPIVLTLLLTLIAPQTRFLLRGAWMALWVLPSLLGFAMLLKGNRWLAVRQ